MEHATALAALVLMLYASPAQATQNIACRAPNNAAWISFLAGGTPGLNPLALSMGAGGKTWSTAKENGGAPIQVSQSFSSREEMEIDVADDKADVIARLRLSRAHEEGQDPVTAGTLHVAGVGAWPVTCGEE